MRAEVDNLNKVSSFFFLLEIMMFAARGDKCRDSGSDV